jgi:hypothetical protein
VVEAEGFEKCALAEGAPDFVALFNFLLIEGKEGTVAPLAILGACNERIAPEAIALLHGRHIRLYPHLDEPGARASQAWARQLVKVGGCWVEAFNLSGCIRDDGKPGKDLADVCRIGPDCFETRRKFHALLP